MIELVAECAPDGTFACNLYNLPPLAIAEVRLQDTMKGGEKVIIVEADDHGSAKIDIPNFGQHLAPRVRLLTEGDSGRVRDLAYSADSNSERLIATESTVQDAPSTAPVSVITPEWLSQEELTHV